MAKRSIKLNEDGLKRMLMKMIMEEAEMGSVPPVAEDEDPYADDEYQDDPDECGAMECGPTECGPMECDPMEGSDEDDEYDDQYADECGPTECGPMESRNRNRAVDALAEAVLARANQKWNAMRKRKRMNESYQAMSRGCDVIMRRLRNKLGRN